MPRYALHGPMYSGKTTLARRLRAAGFALVDYSAYLKQLAARALTAVGHPTTVEDIVAHKGRYRAFLQELGTHVGFDEGGHVEDAIRHCVGPLTALPRNVVFDNVRRQSQYDILERLGFILVRLVVSPQVLRERAAAAGVTGPALEQALGHHAEQPLPRQRRELVLHADLPAEALCRYLLADRDGPPGALDLSDL